MARIFVVFYSLYGHVHRMAEAVAEGARSVEGTEVIMRRVPETLPPDVLAKMGATEIQKSLSVTPICSVQELAIAGAIIFGTPTRLGTCEGRCGSFSMPLGSCGTGGSREEDRERVCQLIHPAWRTGVHDPEFSNHAPPPRHDSCWIALHLPGVEPHR